MPFRWLFHGHHATSGSMTRILCYESGAERRRALSAALDPHFDLSFFATRSELRAAAARDEEAIIMDGGKAWRGVHGRGGAAPARNAEAAVAVSVEDAAALLRQLRELEEMRSEAAAGMPCTGSSAAIRAAMSSLRAFAASDEPLFIGGETGVGKDRAARAAHALSPRGRHPFIPYNCANLDESTASSTLFGSVRGGFTDAVDRRGLFAEAQGGTLFLDEVGSLPRAVQAKLLRAIEGGGFHRVGAVAPEHANVRVISASCEDLHELVAEGRFRLDLMYRLTVLEVWIPPLRERREDIPAIARELCAAAPRNCLGLSGRAEELLVGAEWRGNIRELRSVIERAAILAGGREIGPDEILAAMSPWRGHRPRPHLQGSLF